MSTGDRPGSKGSSKPWGGRFSAETAPEVDQFTASLPFDRRLYAQDIAGSVAHARMLGRQGILTPDEAALIEKGLEDILGEIEVGDFPWRLELEDIHMNIEARLREKIGPVAGKLHTARSRNDQVALDMHLYVRDAIDGLLSEILELQRVLLKLAERHHDDLLPGYTHLQRAQPVRLAHHLLAYLFMFQRDRERLACARQRVNTSPLGAGALAGTTFTIDPDSVARDLGFARRYANSMDAVSDRDFLVETLAASALISIHLSRMGEEMVIWSSSEFGFLEMGDAFTTGSSIMPQKKNPVIGELLRGKSGRMIGSLTSLLVVLKGLPLAYNTDMQEDKEGTFDALDTIRACVRIAGAALDSSQFNTARMRQAVERDYVNATDLADYLVSRGVPFRDAHSVAGQAVSRAMALGQTLVEMDITALRQLHPAFETDVYDALTPEAGAARNSPMGTGAREVAFQIDLAVRLLAAPPGEFDWVRIEKE